MCGGMGGGTEGVKRLRAAFKGSTETLANRCRPRSPDSSHILLS